LQFSNIPDFTNFFHFSYIFCFFLIPPCTFNFFTNAQIIEVHAEKKIEDADVDSLSLSNTTKKASVLNSTITDIANSTDKEATSTQKINTNDNNYIEMCANQCPCNICKDTSSKDLSSVTKSWVNKKLQLESVNKSSRDPSVPTFGKYNIVTLRVLSKLPCSN
jgi:replication initiation and membrane attachment protein DnaB